MRKAVMEGRHERVAKLLSGGADPNARGDGHTATHIAAINNQGEIILELAPYGADVNLRTNSGITAFEYAMRGAQPDALDALLSAGASAAPIGNEAPLSFATKRFHNMKPW